jgi:hypothetical protein
VGHQRKGGRKREEEEKKWGEGEGREGLGG